jgi:hypothetical protein
MGPLCYQCNRGLARFRSNALCAPCDEQPLIYIKLVSSFLFFIAFILFQAKIFSKIDSGEPELGICMKLLMSHFQTLGAITLIDLGWTVDFEFYFKFQDYISFLTQDFLVIDCLFPNQNDELIVIKIIATTLLPIFLSLLMILIWLAIFLVGYIYQSRINPSESSNKLRKAILKLSEYLSERMRITFLVVIYILYPEILRKSFSLMHCVEIDNHFSLRVLRLSPNFECWNTRHTFWVLTVAIPGLIIWGIALPIVIFIVLRRFRHSIAIMMERKKTKSFGEKSFDSMIITKNYSENPANQINNNFINPTDLNNAQAVLNENENLSPGLIKRNESMAVERKSFGKKKQISFVDSPDWIKKSSTNQYLDSKSEPISKVVYNLGFLFKDYKSEFYYWEIVMFSRKFLLIFFGVFTEFFPREAKASIFLVIIFFFFSFQFDCNPYKFDYLNRLEKLSLIVCFFTGNIGILLFSKNLKPYSMVFLVLVALLNLGFIAFWSREVLIKAQKNWHIPDVFKRFRKRIETFIEKKKE